MASSGVRVNGEAAESVEVDVQKIDAFFEQLRKIFSAPAGKGIEALCSQVKSRDDAIVRLETEKEKERIIRHTVTDENCDLRRERDALRKEIEKINSARTEEEQEHMKTREELKKRESTISEMKTAESDIKQKLSAMGKKQEELEEQLKSVRGILSQKDARLDKLESFATTLCEINKEDMEKFSEIWKYATREIYPHLEQFRPDISKNDAMKFQRQISECDIPLPCKNSTAASQMRLVIILTLLAQTIDKYIFQPTYIVSEYCTMREQLLTLEAENKEKESHCRSILLSINPTDTADGLDRRVQKVVQAVSSSVHGLLPQEKVSGLRSSIERVARLAAAAWQPFQQSKQKYEPDFLPSRWGNGECDPFIFPSDETPNHEKADIPDGDWWCTVFPQLCLVESGVRRSCTPAVIVYKSMRQCVAADRELKVELERSKLPVVSIRERRLSASLKPQGSEKGISSGKGKKKR